jgi:hypothetical protein
VGDTFPGVVLPLSRGVVGYGTNSSDRSLSFDVRLRTGSVSLDLSRKKFSDVYPAAGALHTACK